MIIIIQKHNKDKFQFNFIYIITKCLLILLIEYIIFSERELKQLNEFFIVSLISIIYINSVTYMPKLAKKVNIPLYFKPLIPAIFLFLISSIVYAKDPPKRFLDDEYIFKFEENIKYPYDTGFWGPIETHTRIHQNPWALRYDNKVTSMYDEVNDFMPDTLVSDAKNTIKFIDNGTDWNYNTINERSLRGTENAIYQLANMLIINNNVSIYTKNGIKIKNNKKKSIYQKKYISNKKKNILYFFLLKYDDCLLLLPEVNV